MSNDPTPDERRRAVCHAMASAPGLLRYAARFSLNLADAEDAYQRAMEIALQRAPTTDPDRFAAWLRVVVRNEALAITAKGLRERPARSEDLGVLADSMTHDAPTVGAQAEWRERYFIVSDALSQLTPSQRICVLLRATGLSYQGIEEATGFSARKVERSVLEGRAALQRLEGEINEGSACAGMVRLISKTLDGTATTAESVRLKLHVRHCRACRGKFRDRRDFTDGLVALVPLVLLGGTAGHASPPDPGPALAWLDRFGAGATVRLGQVIQVAMDVPGSVAAKVGAGAAVAAVAGSAGLPILTGGSVSPAPAVVQVPVTATARALTSIAAPSAAAATHGDAAAETARAIRRTRTTPLISPARIRQLTQPPSHPVRTSAPATRRAPVSAPSARTARAVRIARPGPSANRAGAGGISLGP